MAFFLPLVPYKAPEGVNATVYKAPNIIKVSWHPLHPKYWNGFRVGYKIFFTTTHVGGELLDADKQIVTIKNLKFNETYYVFTEADVFTKYKVEVLAFTAIGDGIKSMPTTGCKFCFCIYSILGPNTVFPDLMGSYY